MSCSDEWSIGNGSSSCRTLDFNLAFSSAILSIAPSACFIVCSWLLLYHLVGRHVKTLCTGGVLLTGKVTAALGLAAADLLCLIAWTTSIDGAQVGTDAAAVSFVASVCYSASDHRELR